MHKARLLKVWAAFGPHVSEEQCIPRSFFSFHLFPSKSREGLIPSVSSRLPLSNSWPITQLSHTRNKMPFYCQPFHLKCKLILTQCALPKIKVGTLTFPGPHPPSLEPLSGGQGRVPKGAEEMRALGGLALLPPPLSSGMPSCDTQSILVACTPCVKASH